MTDPVYVWSPLFQRFLTFSPSSGGEQGGESMFLRCQDDPTLCGLAPNEDEGVDPTNYFAKAQAVAARKIPHRDFFPPKDVGRDPYDKTTPVLLILELAPGIPLEVLLLPSEWNRLGLGDRYAFRPRRDLALFITRLFRASWGMDVTQNDCHLGNYLVVVDPQTGLVVRVVRIDGMAFGFHNGTTSWGPAAVKPEWLAPEVSGRTPSQIKPCHAHDWFALAAILLKVWTDVLPWVYPGPGSAAERVKRREFVLVDRRPGVKIPDAVTAAYFKLTPLHELWKRALLGPADERPDPAAWERAIKALPDPDAVTPAPRRWTLPKMRVHGLHAWAMRNAWTVAGVGLLAAPVVPSLFTTTTRERATAAVPPRPPATAVHVTPVPHPQAAPPFVLPPPSRRPNAPSALDALTLQGVK